jgi:transcriptional antiterminator RfaH
MILSPGQLLQLEEARWFCVKAQPKHEHIAAANLRKMLDLETFAPRIRFQKATRRGAFWFVEAMFPGYLFVKCLYRDCYRAVQAAPGMRGFVRFGDSVAGVDDATLAALRELVVEEETVTVNPVVGVGDHVQVVEGPFHGLEAVVTQILPANERVKVLLTFLGRQIEAEVTSPRLLPVQSARDATLARDA